MKLNSFAEPIEKIPFIIGVTGYRDLFDDEIGKYRKQVENTLKYFCELDTLIDTPIWVFTALAEGADRLVADVAIKMRNTGLYDLRIIAPLPLDYDVYCEDFSESSRVTFDNILNQVDESFVLDPYLFNGYEPTRLPLPSINKRTNENNWGYSPERNVQYVNLGAFLIRHANIMLSLWDGNRSSSKPGGTAEVTLGMLNQPLNWGVDTNCEAISSRKELTQRQILMGGESGAVVHIPVRRNESECREDTVIIKDQRPNWVSQWSDGEIKWYFSFKKVKQEDTASLIKSSQDELRSVIDKINQLNKEIEKLLKDCLFDDIDKKQLKIGVFLEPNEFNFTKDVERVRQCFKSSEWCALLLQSRAKQLITVLFFSVLFAIISYEVFDELGPSGGQYGIYSLVAFLLGIIIVSSLLFFSKKSKYKIKFHDYRAYSELLRISSYLSYLGINRNITDYFTPDTRSITAWLEHARRTAEYKTWDVKYKKSKKSIDKFNNIYNWWIKGQSEYFNRKVDKTEKGNLISKQKTQSILSNICYVLATIGTAYIAVNYLFGKIFVVDFIWVTVLLYGISAALKEWGELQGYDDDAARYSLSKDMYQWATVELRDNLEKKDTEAIIETLIGLAKLSITENTYWYITHTSKDIGIK